MVKYDCTREQESEKSQTLAVIFKISILAHTQSFILMSRKLPVSGLLLLLLLLSRFSRVRLPADNSSAFFLINYLSLQIGHVG